ncbi:hypothetical protein DY000_02022654 [Brassica cretica]|uniref:Uncharacterized protein n=1 Tax=Brassica cretica TaxID=69181 RepID=A0ABQ7EIN8_BRACR|nr:hypothetical protein DY000_02022654 [Brassica cretica]
MRTPTSLESEHDDVGIVRRRRWSGGPRQTQRFPVEKKKLEAETFVVAPFLVNDGDEQGRQIRSTAWFGLADGNGHDGARHR